MTIKLLLAATALAFSSSLFAQKTDTSHRYQNTAKHNKTNNKWKKEQAIRENRNNNNHADSLSRQENRNNSTNPNKGFTPGNNVIPNNNQGASTVPNTPSVEPNRTLGSPPSPVQ